MNHRSSKMAEGSNTSFTLNSAKREELLAHIKYLEAEISTKTQIIKGLKTDMTSGSASSDSHSRNKLSLETTVAEQNALIEILQEKLEHMQQEACDRENESAYQIEQLKNELENAKQAEEQKLKSIAEELRRHYEKDFEKLQRSYVNDMEKWCLKESFLSKQVELLCHRLDELYDRVLHQDEELEASREIFEGKMEQLNMALIDAQNQASSKTLPEEVVALHQQLAASVTNEMTAKMELNACTKAKARVREELAKCRDELSAAMDMNEKLREGYMSRSASDGNWMNAYQGLKQLHKFIVLIGNPSNTESTVVDFDCGESQDTLDDVPETVQELIKDCLLELKKLSHYHNLVCNENEVLLQDNEVLKEDLNTITEDTARLKNELDQVTNENRELKEIISELELRLRSANSRRSSPVSTRLNNEIDEVKKENQKLKSTISDLESLQAASSYESDSSRVQTQYEIVARENEDLKAVISDMELKLKASTVQKTEIEVLKKNNEELKQELSRRSPSPRRTEPDAVWLKNELDRMRRENEKLNEDLCAAKSDYRNLEQLYGVLNKAVSGQSKSQQIHDLEEELVRLCSKLKHCEEVIQHLEAEKANLEATQYLSLPEGSISPVMKSSDDLQKTPSGMITSTPFPRNKMALQGGGETFDSPPQSLSLIKWMETCMTLDKENKNLRNQIINLQVRIKDLEYSENAVKNEILSFDSKIEELTGQLANYQSLRSDYEEALERGKAAGLKILSLEDKISALADQNKILAEENLILEEKLRQSTLVESSAVSDTILNDLNVKMNEVITLKGRVSTLQLRNCKLNEKINSLVDIKNAQIFKIELISRELGNCREEFDVILKENEKLSSANKYFEKEVELLKTRIKFLETLKDSCWGSPVSVNMAEEMQKQILEVCKEAIDQKIQLENILIDKVGRKDTSQELDARHTVDVLMKSNNQLQYEKEVLLQSILDQQHVLHEYQKGIGVDEGWLEHLEKLEQELLKEIKAHREQHARIEEALRSTGKLHNELQKEKDALKIKNLEMNKLEKKLEEEKMGRKQCETMVMCLRTQIESKDREIETINTEKNSLERSLRKAQMDLADAETRLEYESKCSVWKVKKSELQASQREIENKLFKAANVEELDTLDYEIEHYSKLQKEVELEYLHALKKMEFYYNRQFSSQSLKEQEEHKNQVERLSNVVKEQCITIEKLLSENIIEHLTHTSDKEVHFKEELDIMVATTNEINELIPHFKSNPRLEKLPQKYAALFQAQLLIACKLLKEEHNKHLELVTGVLQEVHTEDLKLQKLQLEQPKSDVNFDVNDVCLQPMEFDVSKILLGHYLNQIQKPIRKLAPAYIKKLKDIENEATALDGTDQLQSLFNNQNDVINSANQLIEAWTVTKDKICEGLKNSVDYLHTRVSESLEEIKTHEASNQLLILKEEIEGLRSEKDKLEKQYKKALQILDSNQSSGRERSNAYLKSLIHFCDVGCNGNALLSLKAELEEKHKTVVEELRTYFEKKCADLEKNFSEEVFSQHSRKVSSSESSCCGEELVYDQMYTNVCGGGDATDHRLDRLGQNKPHDNNSPQFLRKISDAQKVINSCTPNDVDSAVKLIKDILLAGDEEVGPFREEKWEESAIDCMSEEVVWRIINKVKYEMLVDMQNMLGTTSFQAIVKLRQIVDEKLQKMFAAVSTQTRRLEKLQQQVELIKGSASQQRIKDAEKKAIMNFCQDVSELIDDSGHSSFSHDPDFLVIQKIFSNKYKQVLDQIKEQHLNDMKQLKNEHEKELQSFEKKEKYTAEIENELEKVVKERDELIKMRSTLRSAVDQLASYLSTSEDELLQNIASELALIYQQQESPRHVHFSPQISSIIQELDDTISSETFDGSCTQFRTELRSCLNKLKAEAAAFLGMKSASELQAELALLQKRNVELLQQIEGLTGRETNDENVYGEEPVVERTYSFVQDKVRNMVQGKELTPTAAKLLEDIAVESDNALEELLRDRNDLQQQVEAADKQLRSTRQFLEEQAAERELERDEYSKELSILQTQLRDQGKETTARERFNQEMEELHKELKDTVATLSESEKKQELLKSELNAAIEKIWTLREIINDLENQLSAKSEMEQSLKDRLRQIETELEINTGAQCAMAEEIESLRNQSFDGTLEQMQELQESIKSNFNSTVVRQMKAQLKDMEKAIEHQTKELEGLHVSSTTASQSSPSEEISLREQLECLRSKTPEHCPSPVLLPIDEMNKLFEKIHRHARSDEVIMKKVRDQELRLVKLMNHIEDLNAERDVLQKEMEKQKSINAELNNKVDYFRHKVDSNSTLANRDIIRQNEEMKEALNSAKLTLDAVEHELSEKSSELERANQIITTQQQKLCSLVNCDEEAVDSLRLQLAAVNSEKNKLEELVHKYQNELKSKLSSKEDLTLEEMSALIDDKNEDIEQLQRTITLLQSQGETTSKNSSKGLRVSFAADVSKSPEHLRNATEVMTPMELEERPIEPKQREIVSLSESCEMSRKLSEDWLSISLEQTQAELKEKEKTIETLESKIEELVKITTESRQILDVRAHLEAENERLIKALEKAEASVCSLDSLILEKDGEILKLSLDMAALQNIASNLQEKLKEAQALLDEDSCKKSLEDELSQAKHKLQVEESVSDSWKMKTDYLTQENESLKMRLEEVQCEKDDKILELREEMNILQADLSLARQLTLDDKAQIEEMTAEVDRFVEEIEHLTSELNQIRLEKSTVERDLEQTRTELSELMGSVAALKNRICTQSDAAVTHPDIKFIQNEYHKLESKLGLLEFEKNRVQAEVESDEIRSRDEISHLQNQVQELEGFISQLKSANKKNTEKFRCEIAQLRSQISQFQSLEQKFESAVKENEDLCSRVTSYEQASLNRSRNLSQSNISITELIPSEVDISHLSGQVKEQANLSAHLDNSLIDIVEIPLTAEKSVQHNSKSAMYWAKQAKTLEKALINQMRFIKNLKQKLVSTEKHCLDLSTAKLDLELSLKASNEKLAVAEEKRRESMCELEEIKSKRLILELSLHSERTSREQIQTELVVEKQKVRSIQIEDITLIESLRKRLESCAETEALLKNQLMTEMEKRETLEAQLNSIRVMERYKSESQSDSGSSRTKKKISEEHQKKYKELVISLDRERRAFADLEAVLARERKTLFSCQSDLKEMKRTKTDLEKQCSELTHALKEERKRANDFEGELRALKSSGSCRPLNQISKLEEECALLREHLRTKEEHERIRGELLKPLTEEFNDLNKAIDDLKHKRDRLRYNIDCFTSEKDSLLKQLQSLRKERDDLRIDSNALDFGPFIASKLELYLGQYFRAESFRKSLVLQKKYLQLLLKETVPRINRLVGKRQVDPKRRFKAAASLIIFIVRVKNVGRTRRRTYDENFIAVLRAFGIRDKPALMRAAQSSSRPPAPRSFSRYLSALEDVQRRTS